MPVPSRTVPFASGTALTFDESRDLWVFSICVSNTITPGFSATFRVGSPPISSATYPALVDPSDADCGAGYTGYNIIFTEAVGTALINGGFIIGTSPNFTFSAAGVVTFP